MAEPMVLERTVTGIPLWLLRTYLEELGGSVQSDGTLRGPGWFASLSQAEDHRVGSLRVGRVVLALSGGPDAVERLRAALEPRLMRGGG